MAADFTIREFKSSFFDTEKIKNQAERDRRKTLSKLGAFIRQRARTSIRPGGKKGIISQPGQPPRSHEGSLKRLIFFAYDSSTGSVVIGPAKFRAGEAPRLLERGGSIGRKGKTLRYRPRPFMGPAGREETKKLPEILRGLK